MERISYSDVPSGMFEKVREIEDLLMNSPLETSLLYLIKLRSAQINGCAYCVDMHYKELKNTGESELRLSSLSVWRDTPYFSSKERAVLTLTEVLTDLAHSQVTDEVYEPLLNYFDKEEIAYLALAISSTNVWNRLMTTFRFEPGKYRVQP